MNNKQQRKTKSDDTLRAASVLISADMDLESLIEYARQHVSTPEEKREHAISFAYGNVHLHNPSVTREMVEQEYDKLNPRDETEGSL